VALLSFAPLMFADPAHAASVPATITCSDSLGNTNEWKVQWDNENQYFSDKGHIAAHFCEGGFAGGYTTFVSVTGRSGEQLDNALLYFNGIIPELIVPDQPTEITEDVERPTESEETTEDVERVTEDVERPVEETPATPEPSIPEPIVEPTPEPTTDPAPEEPVSPVEPTKPPVEESVQPEASEPPVTPVEPEISPELPVQPESQVEPSNIPVIGAILDAFATAGLDMTEEERERAQSVVIPSVMVAQIAALGMRRVK